MSQYLFENIDPYVDTGVDLATDLNSWKDAIQSSHKGNARPSYAVAGTLWVNDTSSPWKVNVYNGTTDVEIGTMNATTSAFIPTISTPALFNSSVLPATTAFVQRALGNYASVVTVTTTPYNSSNTDYGKVLNCYGSASAINLPPSVTGASLSFYTATPLTFNRSGADFIVARPGEGTLTSATIPGATTGKLIGISGGWLLEVSGDGPRSLAANGYQKLPSGLIIQWGVATSLNAGEVRTITFPVAYPSGVKSPVCTGDGVDPAVGIAAIGTTTFQIRNAGTPAQNAYWTTFGY